MAFAYDEQLRLGYTIGEPDIPPELSSVIDESVDCYRRHHDDLRSVYIIGSVALGDWKYGISDLDTVGVTDDAIDPMDDHKRQQEMTDIGNAYSAITFVDNKIVTTHDVQRPNDENDRMTAGRLTTLALTGVRIWGEQVDFRTHIPTTRTMALNRAARAEALMRKYRSGNLIQAFQDDERLLARSCAKAAMRALSSTTLLRGAPYHPSPYQTAKEIDQYVPEAVALKDVAMAIIDSPNVPAESAMEITDQSVKLFRDLFPDEKSKYSS